MKKHFTIGELANAFIQLALYGRLLLLPNDDRMLLFHRHYKINSTKFTSKYYYFLITFVTKISLSIKAMIMEINTFKMELKRIIEIYSLKYVEVSRLLQSNVIMSNDAFDCLIFDTDISDEELR